MPVSSAYVEYVLEQIARTGRVTSRRMFGGVGLYSDGQFFGLIARRHAVFRRSVTKRVPNTRHAA